MGPLRPADRGDGRLPVGLRAPPPAGPVGRRRGAPADGPPVHDRALPRAARAGSARPCPGSRSRPTSSSGSAARPRPQFEATLRLLETVRYDQVFAAAYSRAARDARDAPRRRRPAADKRRRLERAARAPGGDRARAQPGVARADDRGPRRQRRRRRAATTTTTRPTDAAEARDAIAHAGRRRPPAGRTRENKLVHLTGPAELVGPARRRAHRARRPVRAAGHARLTAAVSSPPLLVIAGADRDRQDRPRDRAAERLAAERHPAPRSSRPTRGRSTAASTSARPRRRPRSGAASRTTASTSSTRTSRSRVADFARHARDALAAIAARGGLAILVGGTGLYLRAVARGLDTDALPSDPASARRLEARVRRGRASSPLVDTPRGRSRRALAARDRPAQPAPRRPRARDRRAHGRRSRCPRRAATPGRSPGSASHVEPRDAPRLDRRPRPGPVRRRPDRGGARPPRAVRPGAAGVLSAIGYREAWAVLDGELTREASDRRGRAAQRGVREAPADVVPREPDIDVARRAAPTEVTGESWRRHADEARCPALEPGTSVSSRTSITPVTSDATSSISVAVLDRRRRRRAGSRRRRPSRCRASRRAATSARPLRAPRGRAPLTSSSAGSSSERWSASYGSSSADSSRSPRRPSMPCGVVAIGDHGRVHRRHPRQALLGRDVGVRPSRRSAARWRSSSPSDSSSVSRSGVDAGLGSPS